MKNSLLSRIILTAGAAFLCNTAPTHANYTGPLFDTSSQDTDAPMEQYVSRLTDSNVTTAIRYFGIEQPPQEGHLKADRGLGKVVAAVENNPGLFVPFFTFGLGGSETNRLGAKEQADMYEENLLAIRAIVGKDVVVGFGEIEQYAWSAPFDSSKVRRIFKLARQYDMHVMIHPKVGQLDQVATVLEDFPNVTVIMHMFRNDYNTERAVLIQLMQDHPNLYFSIDADHLLFDTTGEYPIGLLYKYQNKPKDVAVERFKTRYAHLHDDLLTAAVADYEPLITAVPDQVMWGTESYPSYNFKAAVYQRTIQFSREFIGQFPSSVQAKLAYKNAQRVFGAGKILAE